MGDALDEEFVSINAIYAEDTIRRVSENPTICALTIPGEHHIVLRLEFPSSYPDTTPTVIGTQSVGDHVPKGFGAEAVIMAQAILDQVFVPGSPCVYDLVEDISAQLQQVLQIIGQQSKTTATSQTSTLGSCGQHSPDTAETLVSDQQQASRFLVDGDPPWVLSDTVTERKSVFVARAAKVTSKDQAEAYVDHLLTTHKAVAQATHNITAWRIRGESNTTFQDCDDDGETAAGSRLLHLLQLMDVWNVMVVVSRWYGGVHLGPARFRLINSVARDAIVKGAFEANQSGGVDKMSGKKGEKSGSKT